MLDMDHDVIVISDDEEPLIPVKILASRTKISTPDTKEVQSPPRTPGRLSLSYGKANRCIEMKTGEKDVITISPEIKEEIKSSEAVSVQIAVVKNFSNTQSDSSLLTKEAKLQSIIDKFHKKNEAQQLKAKNSLLLPIPASGPLEPYQHPENVNEVHSSTGSDEMKNNSITRMFDTCREFSTDKDDLMIIEKMWAKVKKCDASYTTSPKFLDFTQSVHAKILLERKNMHLYLKEFYDELERLPSFNKPKLKNAQDRLSTTSRSSEAEAGPSTSHSPTGGHEPDTTSVETGNEKHIQKLEKLMRKCSKKVTKLEQKEMSMDDLDDDGSIYLLIDRYKRKCLQIWKKLCELNGQKKALSGRFSEKKFVYEGSRYPEVNKCVSRLVNRSKRFPDFCDVTDLITQCNTKYDLHLRPFQIDEFAREAFKDIGKELKRRRIMDYEEHFGCPLLNAEELENDPASQDELLNASLIESNKLGMKKADELFESFVLKQVELGENQPTAEGTESQNEDDSLDEDTEKEVPIDGADAESESESESKEEEVEYEIEEEEVKSEIEEVDADIDEEVEADIDEEVEEDIDGKEKSDLEETEVEAISEEHANNIMSTHQTYGASTAVSYKDGIHSIAKRSLTPELSIQPPSKRHTASAHQEVQVRILHNLDDFPEPVEPDLSNQDSSSSEILILN